MENEITKLVETVAGTALNEQTNELVKMKERIEGTNAASAR
jgi:hypothetical protein